MMRAGKTSSLLTLILAAFLIWASFFEVDQTVRAQGQVIPEKRTQVIQVADGGVLANLRVSEGQRVKAGEVIAVLEKERAIAGVQEGHAKLAALEAALIRAEAETLETNPDFGELVENYPNIVAAQQALFLQNEHALRDKVNKIMEALKVVRSEWQLHKKLLATGDVSQVEVMGLERQVIDIEARQEAARHTYITEAQKEVARLQGEISIQRFRLDKQQDVLNHTNVIAPATGVVKYLRVNTLGAVLRAGDELMQISPTGSELIVEVKVSPIDIGQLSIGLPVIVKLDAYDYTVYGALQGRLHYISSDTLAERGPSGQSLVYYRTHVYMLPEQTNPKIKLEFLKPGMTASVDIQVNKRSILRYLAKPVLRAFDGALNQK